MSACVSVRVSWSHTPNFFYFFLQLLEMGDKLIRAGALYADDTPVELMREVR